MYVGRIKTKATTKAKDEIPDQSGFVLTPPGQAGCRIRSVYSQARRLVSGGELSKSWIYFQVLIYATGEVKDVQEWFDGEVDAADKW